jgi:hypothetical protein
MLLLHKRAQSRGLAYKRWVCLHNFEPCLSPLIEIRPMASLTQRASLQSPYYHQYQMLPLRDDNTSPVTHSTDNLRTNQRDNMFRDDEGGAKISWKQLAMRDLKLSVHRDT